MVRHEWLGFQECGKGILSSVCSKVTWLGEANEYITMVKRLINSSLEDANMIFKIFTMVQKTEMFGQHWS